jgi:class 3 adenylate cyclase
MGASEQPTRAFTLMHDSLNLTFLFTDIEGSTSKWEEQPEQMAQAVGRHDATLLRDTCSNMMDA